MDFFFYSPICLPLLQLFVDSSKLEENIPDRSGVYLQCRAVYTAAHAVYLQCRLCIHIANTLHTAVYTVYTLYIHCIYTVVT